MTIMQSMNAVRSTGARYRRRLTSRSDVKGTECPGRSQNRALMRGGRT
jgi:hypothetical protein